MEVIEFSKLINNNKRYLEIAWLSAEFDEQKDSFDHPYLKATKVHHQVIIGDGEPRDFMKMKMIDYKEQLEYMVGACVFHLDKMGEYKSQARSAIALVFSIV